MDCGRPRQVSELWAALVRTTGLANLPPWRACERTGQHLARRGNKDTRAELRGPLRPSWRAGFAPISVKSCASRALSGMRGSWDRRPRRHRGRENKECELMGTDSGAVCHCVCGAAFDDTGRCSAYPCYASVPETHLRNPAWPLGMSLCGRSSGRGGRTSPFRQRSPHLSQMWSHDVESQKEESTWVNNHLQSYARSVDLLPR